MSRKKCILICIIVVGSVYLIGCGLLLYTLNDLNKTAVLYDGSVEISAPVHHPSNEHQYVKRPINNEAVNLGVYKDQLCFFAMPSSLLRDTDWVYNLTVFSEDGPSAILPLEERPFVILDGYLYTDHPHGLMAYEIESGNSVFLDLKIPESDKNDYHYFVEDQTLYYQTEARNTMYYPIQGFEVGEPEEKYLYTAPQRKYSFESRQIICYDTQGNRTVIADDVYKLYPCSEGLVFTGTDNDKFYLYLIEGDSGQVTELFQAETGTTDYAINIHNREVYLSIVRYWKSNDIFKSYHRFEDTSMDGTFRIDLTDRSVKKLTNKSYVQLYIFDNSGIYAITSNDTLYKLDFDGNVLMTLIDAK